MKIQFILVTKLGHVGDVHYDWQYPVIPRVGEYIHVDIVDEGKLIVSKDDHIESRIDETVEKYVYSHQWKVTDVTWCHKDEYFLLVSLFGE